MSALKTAFFEKCTQPAAFAQWFKGSKVVDASGAPLVVFHATGHNFYPTDFWSFSHFGSAAAAKKRFADTEQGWKTYPVFLNIKNPIEMPDIVSHRGEFIINALYFRKYLNADEYSHAMQHEDWAQAGWEERLSDIMLAKKYDGIVYKNACEDSGSMSYIIFDKSQVRSALDVVPVLKDYSLYVQKNNIVEKKLIL